MTKHDNRELRHRPERAIYVVGICPNCHKKFAYNRQISRRKKFCSDKCRYEYYYYNEGYRQKQRERYYKNHPNADGTSIRICPRCNKEFRARATAKYCPDCLEYLAYHEPNSRLRWKYINNFNTRIDCMDRGYIETHKEKKDKKKKLIVFGEEYKNAKALCRRFGISYGIYKRQLDKVDIPEKAVENIINNCGCELVIQYVRRLKNEKISNLGNTDLS